MTVEQMRNDISKAYDSWRWRDRVSGMQPAQVIAIYKRMESNGQLHSQKKKGSRTQYRQMTIFDYGKEIQPR